MKKINRKRVDNNLLKKTSHILLMVLFVSIPFTGLVLESLNINIITFNMIFGLYILTVLTLILTKQWKLIILATIGIILILAITLGLSEVLWYLLKKYFDIDISYR